MITAIITTINTQGYISAFLTIPFSFASFSKWLAIFPIALSRLPDASPASTMFSNNGGNTVSLLMASAMESPFSTLSRTFFNACFNALFSVCSANIANAVTTLTPALEILTNCLQNTPRSLELTFFFIVKLMSLFNSDVSPMLRMLYPSFFNMALAFSMESASTFAFFVFPALSMASYVKLAIILFSLPSSNIVYLRFIHIFMNFIQTIY